MCKSKKGHTKHIRSKHDVEASKVEGINVGAKTKPIPSYVTEEKILSLIREIAESLKDEKIYPAKQVDAVLTLRPNKAFVQDINALLHKFHCKKDRDKFMQEYYGKMYALWKEFFQPCKDHKVAFLMLLNLPERLSKILLSTPENNIYIFKLPCAFYALVNKNPHSLTHLGKVEIGII